MKNLDAKCRGRGYPPPAVRTGHMPDRLSRFRLPLDQAEGDLGGVEELAAPFGRDGADEDAVGGAGYEVADAFIADEHGHGVAVGLGCVLSRKETGRFLVAGIVHVGFEGALPGKAAAADGGFGVGGAEAWSRFERGGGPRAQGGLDQCQFFDGEFGHTRFSY